MAYRIEFTRRVTLDRQVQLNDLPFLSTVYLYIYIYIYIVRGRSSASLFVRSYLKTRTPIELNSTLIYIYIYIHTHTNAESPVFAPKKLFGQILRTKEQAPVVRSTRELLKESLRWSLDI